MYPFEKTRSIERKFWIRHDQHGDPQDLELESASKIKESPKFLHVDHQILE